MIAISRYLQQFYAGLGLPTVRIPAILETDKVAVHTAAHTDNEIRLLYSGDVTGGKELMSEIFAAMARPDTDTRFTFDLYGPSRAQLEPELTADAKAALAVLGDRVRIHGRIPQEEMPAALAAADFGIFIRPKRLSSEAGFPTKLGEYLAAGMPVITNDTGDISLVVQNGENGFIVRENTADCIASVFDKIAALPADAFADMRRKARRSAETLLDPSAYAEDARTFVETVLSTALNRTEKMGEKR